MLPIRIFQRSGAFLFTFLLIAASATYSRHATPYAQVTTSKSAADVSLYSQHKDVGAVFNVNFEVEVGDPRHCSPHHQEEQICLTWSDTAQLTIDREPGTASGHRYRVTATGDHSLKVCFPLNGSHLYGGPVTSLYPAERNTLSRLPYITGISRPGIHMNVAERFWYSSSGLNIHVDPEVPLFVAQNSTHLCLESTPEPPYFDQPNATLSFTTHTGRKNVREAVESFHPSGWSKPEPPEAVVAYPIWSTWVEYKKEVDQLKVLQFADNIEKHGFNASVIEIDDNWETCYGSQIFDKLKFPNPKAMIDELHSRGYLVTLWVHPFIGPGCPFEPYHQYLVHMPNGSMGLTQWWNGVGALIDLNNVKAAEWFEQRLLNLMQDYGVDGFKFDAGEAAYIPGLNEQEKLTRLIRPNNYTRNYVDLVSKFGPLQEVRVGAESGDLKVIQRLEDTNSVWSEKQWGLRSVIRSVLQLSVLGYGTILPDMIGGNAYNGQRPSKELFIRWVQLNTFLPLQQFSLAPWNYDQETLEITRKFTTLHWRYTGKIMSELRNTSHPVINPIWWIAPEEEEALVDSSEFLLGEDILVAPVMEEGAVSRDIYLPGGSWKDGNTGEVYRGPQTLHDYPAPLHILPNFFRQGA